MSEVKTRRSRSASSAIPVERAQNNIISLGDNDVKVSSPGGFSTYTSMYKQHPIVRAAIDKLAKSSIASGYQFVSRDTKEQVNEARQKALNDIFARSRAKSLLRAAYVDLLIYGDCFWFITKSRLGVPYALIRQDPSTVTVVVDKTTREVTSYITRDQQGNEAQWKPDQFIHFRIFDPSNDVYGLSLLESLKSTVAQDLFAQTYNEAFFENSAQTGIVFNMKGASKEEIERNRDFLKKEYTSARNAHKPLLLEGDVSVSKSVATLADMQFIEGRKQLVMEILAVFDVPYTKLGGSSESANRSQSSENDKSFRAESIAPLQSVVEEAINEQFIVLVLSFDDIVFEHREVDQRDDAQKMAEWRQGQDGGLYSINEIRGWRGLGPVSGGEEPFIQTPIGPVPVSMIAEFASAQITAKTQPAQTPGPNGRPPNEGNPAPARAPRAPASGSKT